MRPFVSLIRVCVFLCFIASASGQTAPSGGGTSQPSAPAAQAGAAAAPSGGAAAQATPAAQAGAASAATAPAGSSGCVVAWTSPTIQLTPAQTSASATPPAASAASASGGPQASSTAAGGGASGASSPAGSTPAAGGASTTPGGASPTGTSASITIPGATVSVSPTPTGGAATAKPALSQIGTYTLSLPPDAKTKVQPNNAVDIANQLAGTIPRVLGIIPISNSDLVFLLDLSPKPDDKSAKQKPEDVENDIKSVINKLVLPLAVFRPSVAGASAGKPTQVVVYVKGLSSSSPSENSPPFYKPNPERPHPQFNNASDIASALSSWPQVISVTAVTDSRLVFILDVSPKTGSTVPQDPGPVEIAIDSAVSQLQTFKYPLAAHWITVPVDPEKGNAVDIASRLATNSLPGILSIIPVGNAKLLFLLDETPDSRFPSKPRDLPAMEKEITYAVERLKWGFPTIYVVPFALGTGKNCDVANALVRQIPGVLNIAPVGTTRLAFTIDPSIKDERLKNLESNISTLVSSLAEPVTAPLPNTKFYSQQLYYNHDPTTLASIVNAAFPEVKASAIVPDKIVLSAALPASLDAKQKHDPLQDARRLVTILDQPRPQLSLEAWSFQVSAKKRQDIDAVSKIIREIAFEYNRLISESIADAREELYNLQHPSEQGEEYWDLIFRNYLTDQTFAPPERCCEFTGDLRMEAGKPAEGPAGYALGYRKLFESPPPSLVYMLVALAASTHPLRYAHYVINVLEGKDEKQEVKLGKVPVSSPTCQMRDQFVYDQYLGDQENPPRPRRLQLECVRDVLHYRLFAPGSPAFGAFRAAVADFLYQYKMMVLYPETIKPYFVSRAAASLDSQLSPLVDAFSNDLLIFENALVKDFEKRRIGEGEPKADTGCSEHAKSSEGKQQAESGCGNKRKRPEDERKADRGCKNTIVKCKGITYAASGIVSFKTVTGIQSNVQTTTQNYFNATPPVTLGDLAAAIKSIGSPSVSGTNVVPPALPPFLTANMSANAAAGTLAALQVLNRAPVVAKIGKGLNLQAEAYSSPGASGAELDITVQSTENGAGQVTAPMASNETSVAAVNDDLASRVAQHQVTTRVRVGSLNLFSLSTMESTLARGQAPWKPLDPVFEIPILSELVKKPRGPKPIYHRSFIFINAMLVPTAIDLGWGVTIEPDLVTEKKDRTELFRPARSLDDLFAGKDKLTKNDQEFGRISEYHRRYLGLFEHQVVEEDGAVKPIDKLTLPKIEEMIRIDESAGGPAEPNYGRQVPANLLDPPLDP